MSENRSQSKNPGQADRRPDSHQALGTVKRFTWWMKNDGFTCGIDNRVDCWDLQAALGVSLAGGDRCDLHWSPLCSVAKKKRSQGPMIDT
jgi:hypothetical protein